MSDQELDLSMELGTDILWEESEMEAAPTPCPEDQLQSLVCREEQLFTPT